MPICLQALAIRVSDPYRAAKPSTLSSPSACSLSPSPCYAFLAFRLTPGTPRIPGLPVFAEIATTLRSDSIVRCRFGILNSEMPVEDGGGFHLDRRGREDVMPDKWSAARILPVQRFPGSSRCFTSSTNCSRGSDFRLRAEVLGGPLFREQAAPRPSSALRRCATHRIDIPVFDALA